MSLKSILATLFVAAYLVCPAQEIQNTLLWRISGKNLTQPSYLFGTIHLQDRRVFNFPDSLYTAINNCQTFALEFNPDSINTFLSSYIQEMINDKKLKAGKKLKDVLDKKDIETLQAKINKTKKNVKIGDLSIKQAYFLKEDLTKPDEKPDDMPTFLDVFLYKIAKDKGKKMTGLEELTDQLDLLKNLSDDFDPKELLKNLNKEKSSTEMLVNLYVKRDLAQLQKYLQVMPEKLEEMMLSNRNIKMQHNMDSIMQNQNLFAAVGAAHLPGKNGLINLLKNNGYTVEPVLCNTFTHGSKYVFSTEKTWEEVVDDEAGYSTKMPGKPSDMNAEGGAFKMKIYVDLTTIEGFYMGHIISPYINGPASRDSIMDLMAKNIFTESHGKNMESQNFSSKGITGREFTFSDKLNNYYRIQLLNKEKDLYILMNNSKIKNNSAADTFFHSFKLIEKPTLSWQNQLFPEYHVSAKLPGNKPQEVVSYDADTTVKQTTYTFIDGVANAYYILIFSKCLKGYDYSNDSLITANFENAMKGKMIHYETNKIVDGNNFYDAYEGVEVKGTMIKGRQIHRGNNILNFMAIYPDKTSNKKIVDSFLQSIQLNDIDAPQYIETAVKNNVCKTSVPVPFTNLHQRKNDNESKLDNTTETYISWDSLRLVNFELSRVNMGKYYFSNNDTANLKKIATSYFSNTETASSFNYKNTDKINSVETIAHSSQSFQQHRIKIIEQGHYRYVLQSYIPKYLENDISIGSFFNSFEIIKPDTSQWQDIKKNWLADLHSSDSATYTTALEATDSINFNKSDVPILLKEYASNFSLDTSKYYRATDKIFSKMEDFADEISNDEIINLYKNLPVKRANQKLDLLRLFAVKKDTVVAFAQLKKLLLEDTPTDGYAYSLQNAIENHLAMAKTLFPELLRLTNDSATCSLVCNVAKKLIDSNYLHMADVTPMLPTLFLNSKVNRSKINKENGFDFGAMVNLLAVLNTVESWNEIKQYQFVNDNYVRSNAVELMLENKMVLDEKAIDSLAADKAYRISIYDSLKTYKLSALFPKRFLQQQFFAESNLYNYFDDDDDDDYSYMKLIGEKITNYNGKTGKFYLYELKYAQDDKESYLGVSGPFNINPAILKVNEKADATGVYNELPLNKKQLDTQLKNYLKQQLKDKKEYDALKDKDSEDN